MYAIGQMNPFERDMHEPTRQNPARDIKNVADGLGVKNPG